MKKAILAIVALVSFTASATVLDVDLSKGYNGDLKLTENSVFTSGTVIDNSPHTGAIRIVSGVLDINPGPVIAHPYLVMGITSVKAEKAISGNVTVEFDYQATGPFTRFCRLTGLCDKYPQMWVEPQVYVLVNNQVMWKRTSAGSGRASFTTNWTGAMEFSIQSKTGAEGLKISNITLIY